MPKAKRKQTKRTARYFDPKRDGAPSIKRVFVAKPKAVKKAPKSVTRPDPANAEVHTIVDEMIVRLSQIYLDDVYQRVRKDMEEIAADMFANPSGMESLIPPVDRRTRR